MATLGRMALVALGILAYQNRDKLGALLRGNGGQQEGANQGDVAGAHSDRASSGQDGLLDRAMDSLRGTGLGDLIDSFRRSGNGEAADSWVSTGTNAPIEPDAVKHAIDPETLAQLSAQTGLSEEELLRRLALEIPRTVDKLTPNGELPPRKAREGLLDEFPAAGSA